MRARAVAETCKPLIYFNAGRIISYTLLGGAIGALGSALTLVGRNERRPHDRGERGHDPARPADAQAVSVASEACCQECRSFRPQASTISRRERHARAARSSLGAATFFLPCGFTQALQTLCAARRAAVAAGALTMLAFSLGTCRRCFRSRRLVEFRERRFQKHFAQIENRIQKLARMGMMTPRLAITVVAQENG